VNGDNAKTSPDKPPADDPTIAAIKTAQRTPIPLPPELVRAIIRGGVIPAIGDGPRVPTQPVKRGRGRPKVKTDPARSQVVAERNAGLLSRLDCQIKRGLPELPKAAAVKRFAAGDPMRQRVRESEQSLANVSKSKRAAVIAKKIGKLDREGRGENVRHVRRVLKQLKK
jgi:hypothetical protein